jgi:beta-glucosidase
MRRSSLSLRSKKHLLFVHLLLFTPLFAQGPDTKPLYLDYTQPVEKRVDDLVSRMTLEEKVSQMINGARAIPRLQIPEYDWWNECLHGVARAGTATVFPQAIGLSASWDTDMMRNVADVISTEARAKNNEFLRLGERDIYKGLTFWSPNINIFRDPRWGRGQETYGEDPYLTARMGVSFVKGLQGDDPRYFKVISTPKHYAVHSGPEPDRHTFNAIIDNHDLYDTYLPAFEACIREAGAFSVMCAYNRFMGDACCGSPELLRKILREKWGFKGYVVSDCGAINDIFENHKVVKTAPEAAAKAVKSGTDLECGTVYTSALLDAVKQGLITEDEIAVSVKRLFTARFRLGMFDPPEIVKYARIPISENDSPEHRVLSLRAARESIVLLKNSNNILPIKKEVKRIAVIGPNADNYLTLLGNYNGTPSKYVTPLQGIKNKSGNGIEVKYEAGCDVVDAGGIVKDLSSDVASVGGEPGLKVEFFKNKELSGEPFLTRRDELTSPNWFYSSRVPSFSGSEDISSIRWSGLLTAPATGEFDLMVKSDGGFRLLFGDSTIFPEWTNHDLMTKEHHISLEQGKTYRFAFEFSRKSHWPQLSIQWKLLNSDHARKAVELAKSSDLVIFVGGITPQLEGEEMQVNYEGFKGGDRTNLNLPVVQEDLLKELQATRTPVVLVLTSGSALAVNWEKENLPAIVQLWYPGEEGGTALADVLFGEYNPAGRLPVTFYESVDQLPPFEDYNMKGRTYRYFDGEPLFPFGYGLSYTKFSYHNLVVPSETMTGDSTTISVEVQNTGTLPGDEVVELYVKNLSATVSVPIHSLQGFRRIHLDAGQKRTVEFTLMPKQLAVINADTKREVDAGDFEIAVGGIQPGTKSPTTEVVAQKMKIVGKPFVIE